MNLKLIGAGCTIALLWLWQIPSGFTQVSVSDMSEELWQKFAISAGYSPSNCQFAFQQDQSNSWWGCVVFILPEAKDAGLLEIASSFIEVIAINEDGDLGKNQLIALKEEGERWQDLLAIGMKGTLLLWDFNKEDDFLVAALALPTFASSGLLKLPLLWQYDLPTRTPYNHVNYSPQQVTATKDGGYVILIQSHAEEDYTAKRDWFALLRLTAEGQKVWQYIGEKDFLPEEDEDFSPSDDKNFLMFSKDKIALYGYFGLAGKNGITVLCLNAEGQEMGRQVFKGYYWKKAIPWFQSGFAFFNPGDEKRGEISYPFLSVFNQDCQKIANQPLKLPNHGMESLHDYKVETAAMAPNGNLVVIYRQSLDSEGISESPQSLPNLYLAEVNPSGMIVCDIPLITGADKNRAYLQTFEDGRASEEYGEEGYDLLKVNLLFPKQASAVLVSVYNKGIDYQEHLTIWPEHWFPKMYKVKLPCQAEIAQIFK